jgi:hypothetical protein
VSKIDPVSALRDALDVLSRAEIETAWRVGGEATKVLGANVAIRAELAAYVMARILDDIGRTSKRDDLADVAAAVESFAVYLAGRVTVLVTELGSS